MQKLTSTLIRSLCPNALPEYVDAFCSSKADEIFSQWGINETPGRMAAFMGNVCHETGGLRIVRESGYYRAITLMRVFRVRYRKSADSDGDGISDLAEAHAMKPRLIMNFNYGHRLGNEDDGTNDDDGYNFRGGGPLQATGKRMYRWLQKETGLPFVDEPLTIENPEHWALVAALTWCKWVDDLNDFADQGNFEACCRAINTGNPFSTYPMNGLADRNNWHAKWSLALGMSSVPVSGIYRYGSPRSVAVETIQERLNALRYGEGRLTVDGIFGTRTRDAVYSFQLVNKIKADGIVGPQTWGVLNGSGAKPYPPPAAVAGGVTALRKSGDPEIIKADKDRAAAALFAAAGTVSTLKETGTLDIATGLAKDAGAWQSALTTLISILKFGSQNLVPILCIVGAIFLYRRFGAVVYERVEKWTRPVGVEKEIGNA